MTRAALLTLASAIALSACAGAAAAPPTAVWRAATLLSDSPAGAASAAAAVAKDAPVAGVVRARKAAIEVEGANRAAIEEPDRGAYVGAIQIYGWAEGTLYRLYTAPGQVSDIALQPGETLVSVAAGDTERWVIGDTTSGTGAARRTHVLVKPAAAGLRTNLVIATDRRIYHVEVESSGRAAMAGIAWSYPDDPLLALRAGPGAPETPVAAGVAVESLNFDYAIEGDKPDWRPLRAFDDGRQVFIEFPATLAQGEAPPLFVTGEDGRAELVNYRLRGRYYVVDRLFAAAELRLGGRRQQVVRIVRQPSRRGRRGS